MYAIVLDFAQWSLKQQLISVRDWYLFCELLLFADIYDIHLF
jgi:hypothetical protein